MKRIASVALVISLLALASCASTRPCPAYAKEITPKKGLS
jgi:hypothetical protein